MSLLAQQRIRIVSTMDGSREPWATFCPCCHSGGTHPTWPDACAWAEEHLRRYHCRFCIDHQKPAGRDDVLGELFERCPFCTPVCEACDGISVYPANYNTPNELVADLAILRLIPIFCDDCYGVVALVPADPEVLT